MVQTISKLYAKEDKVDEFIEVFKEMIPPTKEEEGCIQYEMYQDEEEPSLLIVLEQWATKEAFDGHLETDHFKRIVPRMTELMAKESEFNLCRKVV